MEYASGWRWIISLVVTTTSIWVTNANPFGMPLGNPMENLFASPLGNPFANSLRSPIGNPLGPLQDRMFFMKPPSKKAAKSQKKKTIIALLYDDKKPGPMYPNSRLIEGHQYPGSFPSASKPPFAAENNQWSLMQGLLGHPHRPTAMDRLMSSYMDENFPFRPPPHLRDHHGPFGKGWPFKKDPFKYEFGDKPTTTENPQPHPELVFMEHAHTPKPNDPPVTEQPKNPEPDPDLVFLEHAHTPKPNDHTVIEETSKSEKILKHQQLKSKHFNHKQQPKTTSTKPKKHQQSEDYLEKYPTHKIEKYSKQIKPITESNVQTQSPIQHVESIYPNITYSLLNQSPQMGLDTIQQYDYVQSNPQLPLNFKKQNSPHMYLEELYQYSTQKPQPRSDDPFQQLHQTHKANGKHQTVIINPPSTSSQADLAQFWMLVDPKDVKPTSHKIPTAPQKSNLQNHKMNQQTTIHRGKTVETTSTSKKKHALSVLAAPIRPKVSPKSKITSAYEIFLQNGFQDTDEERFSKTMRNHEEGSYIIPGHAGVDYPVGDVKETYFQCGDKLPGFYADMDTKCQVWHYCKYSGEQESYLCPNGTIFNQKRFICDWWYNVECESSPFDYHFNTQLYNELIRIENKQNNVMSTLSRTDQSSHQHQSSVQLRSRSSQQPSQRVLTSSRGGSHLYEYRNHKTI